MRDETCPYRSVPTSMNEAIKENEELAKADPASDLIVTKQQHKNLDIEDWLHYKRLGISPPKWVKTLRYAERLEATKLWEAEKLLIEQAKEEKAKEEKAQESITKALDSAPNTKVPDYQLRKTKYTTAPTENVSSNEIQEKPRPKPEYEKLTEYFPGKYRPLQKECLESLQRSLLDPKVKYIIFEGPPGIGKSWLAVAAALASKSCYIATMNKYLQGQYLRDFDEHLVEMKGRSNYRCHEDTDFDCSNAPCRRSKKGRGRCSAAAACGYHEQLREASKSDATVFNFSAALSFLNHKQEEFGPRNLLIIDEAHQIPNALTSAATLELHNADLVAIHFQDKHAEIPLHPEYQTHLYKDYLLDLLRYTAQYLEHDDKSIPPEILRKVEKIQGSIDMLFEASPDLKGIAVGEIRDINTNKLNGIYLKPTIVSTMAHNLLFKYADKVVMMSATILDFQSLSAMVGLDTLEPGSVAAFQAPAIFPVANRPIRFKPVGSLSQETLGRLLPDIVKSVESLMTTHAEDKGIIHGTTYKICQYIYDNIDPKLRSRLLFPRSARQQPLVVAEHTAARFGTVLLSPSMTEGVDLHGDLARFAIIVKMPYPYLGDPVVRVRKAVYPNYYNWQTLLTVVQAYGRAVRSTEDKAVTYILDGAFERLHARCGHIFPPWFEEAIEWYKN